MDPSDKTSADRESILKKSKFRANLPEDASLFLDAAAFVKHVQSSLRGAKETVKLPVRTRDGSATDSVLVEQPSKMQPASAPSQPFMDALHSAKVTRHGRSVSPLLQPGQMLTGNCDVTNRNSGSTLVDLFSEVSDAGSGQRLNELLNSAWSDDASATLKIIWNARSIHLGKSSREAFYRCYGWLAENHPQTALANLRWVARPIIAKKSNGDAAKSTDSEFDDDMVVIERDDAVKVDEHASWDVKNGVAHGYWKDLLNILALAANDQLSVFGNPSRILNDEQGRKTQKPLRIWSVQEAESKRSVKENDRYENVVRRFSEDPFYRALHLSVARLFAEQLKEDNDHLKSGDKQRMRRVSLAAKWAPSLKGFHDNHTRIASTIAEAMYNIAEIDASVPISERELYLRYAREEYRRLTLSPLRKHLEVVERDISAETFNKINYDRVPSNAMNNYGSLFAKKDLARFDAYISGVAQGKKSISGATLLPSTLVKHAKASPYHSTPSAAGSAKKMLASKLAEIELKVVDGQWNTLVQRIKDSGTLQSAISVCDVSGSMEYPTFKDGTAPMDSAIGLSLLLAELTKPPFGGAIITFSENPQVVRVGGEEDKRSLAEKVRHIERSQWAMNTDFVAVFERLILPMAIENKIKQEDMVKQVFVFSDMQFDAASGQSDRFTTSYDRIKKKFARSGYEMPRMIFWNLAGKSEIVRHGYTTTTEDKVAAKPVTAFEEGTALVSGYSQGQMKMFLENGQFDGAQEGDEEDEISETTGGENYDDTVVIEKKAKKQKMDPLGMVKKAISHNAYQMLRVAD